MSTFTPDQAQQQAHRPNNTRLFPEEVETLLRNLLQNRWQRLSSEYHDPLGMLFGNRAKQWTAGWDVEKSTLYLLFWETDSWQEKPFWSLYQNGTLIFQEEDGFSKNRSAILQELLESEHLPFLDATHFLEPLIDFRFSPDQRWQAGQALAQTIMARPEVFGYLKEPLLQTLETDLSNPDWPVLDILKLHRVAHKAVVVDIIRQCVNSGLFRAQKDTERLNQALDKLRADFSALEQRIAMLFQPALQRAHSDFKRVLTDGNWQARLYSASTA